MMRRFAAATLAVTFLAGCGGGQGAFAPRTTPGGAKDVSVAISIAIPHGASGKTRLPAYVSLATHSAVVDVTPAAGSATHTVIACDPFTCSGTVPAALGTDVFAIALNDKADGSGNTLSRGQTTATIIEGIANSVSVTFGGVIASLTITFDNPNPQIHTATVVAVHVTALDAAGNRIFGPGNYDSPISIADQDPSGATALSRATIAAPGDPAATVAYSGARIGGETAAATIAVSVPGNPAVKLVSAQIVPVPIVTEFPIVTNGVSIQDIAEGADGAIWFTEEFEHQVGRITTTGATSFFAVPKGPSNGALPSAFAMTAGTDGNIWFSDIDAFEEAVDQITPPGGAVTRHAIGNFSETSFKKLIALAWGSDNNVWAVDAGRNLVVKFSTSAFTETDFAIPTANSGPQAIAAGPDGALWFTEGNSGKIGRVTTAGAITEFTVTPVPPAGVTASAQPAGITSGPDGALWFVDSGTGAIGRITTTGAATEFAHTAAQDALGLAIIAAPDGALYYNVANRSSVGRISVNGTLQVFPISNVNAHGGKFPKYAIGSDGNIWYVDGQASTVGRIAF